MSEKKTPLLNAQFRLSHGLDQEQWEVEIHGTFRLWELPKLKQLLDIYASMGLPAEDAKEPAQ